MKLTQYAQRYGYRYPHTKHHVVVSGGIPWQDNRERADNNRERAWMDLVVINTKITQNKNEETKMTHKNGKKNIAALNPRSLFFLPGAGPFFSPPRFGHQKRTASVFIHCVTQH